MPGTFASMGSLEYVMFFFSKAMTWRPGASRLSARKIMFLDASRVQCRADAMSEMAIGVSDRGTSKGQGLGRRVLEIACTIGRRSGRTCSSR